MFKINPDPTFTAPVKIPVHGGEPQELVVVFKHMNETELDAFYKKLDVYAKKKPRTTKARNDNDAEILMEFVVGWQDVDGEFDKKNLSAMLGNYKQAGKLILDAWEREIHQAPAKN